MTIVGIATAAPVRLGGLVGDGGWPVLLLAPLVPGLCLVAATSTTATAAVASGLAPRRVCAPDGSSHVDATR